MPTITSLVPEAITLLALQPEDLAGPVLFSLAGLREGDQNLHRKNYLEQGIIQESYSYDRYDEVQRALMEAWIWLEHEGLIAPKPSGGEHGWYFVTRRGKTAANESNFAAYKHARLLPHRLLHPTIAQNVWAMFVRGDYDTAVFQAFKDVEVGVRKVGNYPASLLGVNLMHEAFRPKGRGKGRRRGRLTDPKTMVAEQEALMQLFAGAIGSYKNPHSHRSVTMQPTQAVEKIVLASHLLNIVESRAQPRAETS